MKFKFLKIKLVLICLLLGSSAAIPLIGNLLPEEVHYSQSTESVSLKTGENRIGDIVITVDKTGRVIKATKVNPQNIKRFLGFRNLRTFLRVVAPFFTSLVLCGFLFWYYRQPKTRRLLRLRKWVLRVFFFVSLWFTYWAFIIQHNTIPELFRYIAIYAATILSLIAAYLLYCLYVRYKYSKIDLWIRYTFGIWDISRPYMPDEIPGEPDWRAEACQELKVHKADNIRAVDVLDRLKERPKEWLISFNLRLVKFYATGLLLYTCALMPFGYQLTSKQVT